MVTFMIDYVMFPYTENTTWHSEDCSLIAARFTLPVKFNSCFTGRLAIGFISTLKPITEAATSGILWKKVFLEIWQNS